MPLLGSRAGAALKAFGFTIASVASIARDLYFRFNGLLLKGNTGDAADTIKMTPPPVSKDYSGNNVTISPINIIKTTRANPVTGNYYSTQFTGSNYVDYALGSTGAAAFGTADFTIEFWVFPTAAPATSWTPILTIGTATDGQEIRIGQNINATGYGVLFPNSASTYAGFGTLTLQEWHHIALVRNGSNLVLYRNGAVINTWTSIVTNFTNNTLFRIGSSQPGYADGSFSGYVHGVRIVKGTPVYTTAFTPSTAPLTAIPGTTFLGLNSPYHVDISSNNLVASPTSNPVINQFIPFTRPTITEFYGGASLTGTSPESLQMANSVGNFGANNFTVEGWFYFNTNTGGYQPLLTNAGAADQQGWALITETNNYYYFYYSNNGSTWATALATTTQPRLYTWTHLAVVRNGTTVTLYQNGISVGTASISGAIANPTGNAYIGYYPYFPGGARSFNGYISNVRFANNNAVYTAPFTPPTALLTSVTGTTLLTAQYSGSISNNSYIDHSGVNSPITRTGNTTQGTFSPYVSSYSTYFNGSSDFITVPQTISLPTTTTPFTMEAWIYMNATTGGTIASNVYAGSGAIPFVLGVAANTQANVAGLTPFLNYYNGSAWAAGVRSTVDIALNTWVHIAGVFNGTVASIYVDGVRQNTWTTSWTTSSQANFYLGRRWDTAALTYFSGYISNFRLTIGSALYSGTTYTVPSQTLTALPNTKLLLASDGTLTEKSNNRYDITLTGTPKASLNSPFSPSTVVQNTGYYSTYFSAAYVSTPTSALFNIGTGDFTVEFWYYMTATGTYGTVFNLGAYNTGIMIRIETTTYSIYIVNTQVFLTGTAPLNTWVHLALVRKTGSVYLWANGVQVGSTVANSTSISPTSSIVIGTSSHTTGENFTGYVTNVRLVVGSALYIAPFTSPTIPLTAVTGTQFLGLQDPTQVDNSVNNFSVTRGAGTLPITTLTPFSAPSTTTTTGALLVPYVIAGSVYFDGTGDFIALSHNNIYDLSSGKWTIDCWVFLTGAATAYRTFISKRGTNSQWEIGVNPTNSYLYFYNNTVYLTTTKVSNNMWYHCAASYDGTNLRMFVNGVLGYTGAVTAAAGTDSIYIGAITGSTQTVTGYIAGMRVTKGRALFTSGFIPPTSPPAPTPQTILLVKGDSPGIYDSSAGNNLEAVGSAKVSNTVVKFNTGSIALNGSTDYLRIPGNSVLSVGAAPWTVESWVYLNALPTSDAWPTNWSLHMVLFGVGTTGQGDGFDCIIGQTKLICQSNDTPYASTSTHGLTINTWHHIAYVRSGNVITFYVNGNSIGSVAFTGSIGVGSTTYIGCETGEGAFFNGYIDDLRFSRFARYTGASFQVPTSSAQDTGPTI